MNKSSTGHVTQADASWNDFLKKDAVVCLTELK